MKTLNTLIWVICITMLPALGYSQCVNCQSGTVTGTNASGIGTGPSATGNSAFAGGTGSLASGDYSFAFGDQASAQKLNSVAFGYKSISSGKFGTAMGWNAVASGEYAVALGLQVESSTVSSFTIGRNLKATASQAFIIGTGYSGSKLLINNLSSSLMIGFNSTLPTFLVSSSAGETATGKIGIGNVTNPTAKLHLLSDDGEAAELKLEHRTTGLRQYAQIYLGAHTIRAGNTENMVFTTPVTKHFAFMNGNLGIGIATPSQKLDIDGNICLRNNGAIGSWSDNSLGFVTNGKVRMTILNTGNVGLATITPLQPLHVSGNVLLTGKNSTLLFSDEPPTNGNWGKWGIEYESGGLNFWRPFESKVPDQGNYDPKAGATNFVLFIKDNGNVGIGTNMPAVKFHVNEGSTLLNGNLQVGVPGNNRITSIYGKVGLGTDNPLSALQVNGSVSVGYNVHTPPGSTSLIVNGPVGIGTFTPTVPLEVVGKIKTTEFQLTTGYMNGYILKSDGNGNAMWASPSTIDDGDWTRNGNNITVDEFKKIGIGTTTPAEALDLNGNLLCSGNIKGGRTGWEPFKIMANSSETDGSYILLSNNNNQAGSVKFYASGTDGRIEFHNQNMQVMSIRADNNVYLGNPETNTNLFVNGEISCGLVRVNTDSWWDCVFNEGYALKPLLEVESYIKKNKHLPEIPSEKEVMENGIDLGKMNALLLRKVEELTLYVIELEKRIKSNEN